MSINGISSLHEVAHFFSQYYNLTVTVRGSAVKNCILQENVEEASF